MIFTEIQSAILSEPELDAALELAHIYGNLLWFADVGIYDASDLEQELISRCTATPNRVVVDVDAVVRGSVIHVVTEPYVTGGHTRLMEKLAGMHDRPVDLLITKRASKAALDRVSRYFKSVVQIGLCTPLERVFETTDVLSRYEKIVLHLHPDDIYTVVACGLLNRRAEQKVFFVNHADHVFSFGCSVADYYFELSSYGRRLDALKKIKGVKSFLGIPIDVPEKKYESAKVHLNSESLHFITAASDIKFKPVKGLSLTVLLNRILTEYPNCKVSVIGSNIKTAYWWWLLKVKYKKRFLVIPIMPHSEYLATMQGADFFVDSYPIPGGTAFAEQFVLGRRCVGLVSDRKSVV